MDVFNREMDFDKQSWSVYVIVMAIRDTQDNPYFLNYIHSIIYALMT